MKLTLNLRGMVYVCMRRKDAQVSLCRCVSCLYNLATEYLAVVCRHWNHTCRVLYRIVSPGLSPGMSGMAMDCCPADPGAVPVGGRVGQADPRDPRGRKDESDNMR